MRLATFVVSHYGATLWAMPTRHQRIPVTNDPELADALRRVSRYYSGAPVARVLRDLALKGAEAVEREEHQQEAALERLVALSTERGAAIDWDVLERVDELAWGE